MAAVLNVGGLWLLYAGGLYAELHHHPWLHLAVHAHVLASGYLLTQALVGVDPMAHRRGFVHRAVVLVLVVAAHDILAKHIYAHPPVGVFDGRAGAMLMYYGGDAISVLLMILLCARWSRRLAIRPLPAAAEPPATARGRLAFGGATDLGG